MKNFQPKEAWSWLQAHPDALFVDVRMEIESLYVGPPPGVVNVPWYEYPDLQPDAQKFADAVAREAAGKAQPVLLICRSGKRTLDAGKPESVGIIVDFVDPTLTKFIKKVIEEVCIDGGAGGLVFCGCAD